MNTLTKIQTELKAPKGQFNSFGKYKYRNCEDILEALKPLLKETESCILLSDEVVMVGDRFYVKATVTLKGEEQWSATAFAREATTKKGMDEAQITGSASSYARKYALNGLFAIDDTKDADNFAPTKTVAQQTVQADIKGVTEKINKTKTLAELGEVWKGMTPKERAFTVNIKDAKKDALAQI